MRSGRERHPYREDVISRLHGLLRRAVRHDPLLNLVLQVLDRLCGDGRGLTLDTLLVGRDLAHEHDVDRGHENDREHGDGNDGLDEAESALVGAVAPALAGGV